MELDYEQAWRDLRRRESVNGLVLGVGGLVVWRARALEASTWFYFYLAWLLAILASMFWMLNFRCPRCGGRFLGRLTWRATLCKHCGLPHSVPKRPFSWQDLAMLGALLGGVAEYLLVRLARIEALGPKTHGPSPWLWWLPGACVGALLGGALALVLRWRRRVA